MHTNSRFAVAIHTLTLLALSRDEIVTSEYIASSVNTNPVVVRRVLGALRARHLVTSQGGNGGGWQLVRGPEAITLREVYRAVEDEALFPLHHRPPNPHCPVGGRIQRVLTAHFAGAARAMEEELARTTVADVLQEVSPPAS
jgi:Rrf2 family protein